MGFFDEEHAISLAQGTIGLVIPFVITDPGTSTPISNAGSASITWINPLNFRRPLVLSSVGSAVFTWTITAQDSRLARIEDGVLAISFGTNLFYSSSFQMSVHPRFE